MTHPSTTIAGAGIAGLSSALALSRIGARVTVAERSAQFSEVGAGIQLGPNAVRRLLAWGLDLNSSLQASVPERLQVLGAADARERGCLRLGDAAHARYGATYATVHRADLHAALLHALRGQVDVDLHLNQDLRWRSGSLFSGDQALAPHELTVVADGVWSQLRSAVVEDGPPFWTGHVAYRALARMADLPTHWRVNQVTVWLGHDLHVVHYPVRGGEYLNAVVLAEAPQRQPSQDWDQAADAQGVRDALRACHPRLQALVDDCLAAGAQWRLWALAGRAPVRGAHELVRDRVALAGDAAHPMLPYLAQGAGMAIEDAQALAEALVNYADVPQALQAYAQARWQRVARVQARAMRNGRIFHLRGPIAWARDAAMRMGGEAVLDVPWLYAE